MPDQSDNSDLKKIKETLMLKRVSVWDRLDEEQKERVFLFAQDYMEFINKAKTEREAILQIIKFAEGNGFKSIEVPLKKSKKIYRVTYKKAAALGILGKKDIEDGVRIIASHIDSPRLDLKQNPLYEDTDLALLKTHYYGGIKKYQWVSRPLALHGKVIKKDGKELDLIIGEDENDPVFTIVDLAPHLARKAQYDKKLEDAVIGEKLNIIAGSIPFPEEDTKERIKLQVLKYLNDKFGLIEEDFVSAELELVPSEKARDIGWDKSLIGSYGQDDRSCAYTSMRAIGDINNPKESVLVLFLDKEEIGSDGNTGAKSRLLEIAVSDLFSMKGIKADSEMIRRTLMNSRALSADVNGAFDPDYKDVHEKRNAAKIGYGICITKFTGSRGKSGSNDASAEYVGWLRKVFNRNNIVWQTGELGKVDEGGGGTIAKFFSSYGMDIIDCGVALLGMHSPFEVSSKADIYMTYKGYKAFLTEE
ncbi:MAG: aminopeptidase [Thermodesulfobacteriota bacterium]|nr:aminopeptidase [Thermodesulfobacteriota bacterium]